MLSLELDGRCRLGQTIMLHEVAEPVGPQFVVPCLLMSRAREKTVCADSTRVAQTRTSGIWKGEALQDHTRGFASGIIC